jgi:putative sigma-54 modulation protein
MESSPSLRDYAAEKLKRIVDKYVKGPVNASLVMTVEKYWHIANFTLRIKNLTVKGKERSEDMYSSIDLALEKIEKQLRRHRDRLKDHKPRKNGKEQKFRMGVLAQSNVERDSASVDEEDLPEFEEDFDMYPGPEESDEDTAAVVEKEGGQKVRVLRNQEYTAQPMTVEEATLQLDLLDEKEFFVFSNVDNNKLGIVYERNDGNVGLIEA